MRIKKSWQLAENRLGNGTRDGEFLSKNINILRRHTSSLNQHKAEASILYLRISN